jgi:hypothetical protein
MSGVFQNIDPLPPLVRGRTHSLGGKGVGGQYFGSHQTLLCTLYSVLCEWDSRDFPLQVGGEGGEGDVGVERPPYLSQPGLQPGSC